MQDIAGRVMDGFLTTSVLEPVRAQRKTSTKHNQSDVVRLWRETIQVLGTHSAPILFFSFIGLVSASLLSLLAGLALLSGTNGFPTRSSGFLSVQVVQIIIQGITGAIGLLICRGAITWIALHHDDPHSPQIADAFRAMLKRWRVLLVQALVYGTVILICSIGLSSLLRELRLDSSSYGRFFGSVSDLPRIVGIRTLNTLLPDAGSPFSDALNYLRLTWSRQYSGSYALYSPIDHTYFPITYYMPWRYWLIGFGSIALVVITETLFRFRTVTAMRAEGPGSVAGLTDSLRVAWQRFGFVTAQVWFLRLVVVLGSALFIVLPMAFVQSVFIPLYARQVGGYWLYTLSQLVFNFSSAVVGIMWLVFGIVFDTRLYQTVLAKPR